MKETVLNFGPGAALVGILTRPTPGATTSDARVGNSATAATNPDAGIAVVILNAGVIHRVGPSRLHVRLARTLAAHGYPCFRFDLPGIGDSRTLGTGGTLLQENIIAITAAFDALERRGVARQFVVFGLCSGADHAFIAACADQRVAGVAMVDPTRTFPTWKSRALRAWRWLVRPAAWLRFVLGHYRIMAHVRNRLRPTLAESTLLTRAQPPGPPESDKQAVAEALKKLVARRVTLCYIITGTQRHRYNYRRQLFDAFPGIGLEDLSFTEIFPSAIHTMPREEDRARLEQTLIAWLNQRFASTDPPRAPTAERPRRAVQLTHAIRVMNR